MSSAMAANPTSTEIVFSFWSTRTALRLLKWLGWGALCFAGAAAVFTACVAAYVAVAEHRRQQAALARQKREQQLRRWQRARMMRTVRDAAYEQMVAARVVRNPCVVCRTEYEDGETCSFLPRCAHVFHKRCIAAWLLHHDTCPICDAAVLAPAS
ncbi:unnamed protein product [Urochloa humidicola]